MKTQSDSITNLVAALVAAQKTIKQPLKNAANPHFKSKFADLGACFDAVREPLNLNGLVLTQVVTVTDAGLDVLETKLLHVSGEWLSSFYRLAPAQNTPQAVGSAITYAKRYALCAMLGLVADVDDDASAAMGSTNAPATPAVTVAPRKPLLAPRKPA